MAEQFLKRPKVRAACQQMCCKAVAQRMRRQRFRQPKSPPSRGHCTADEIGVERCSARAQEKRGVTRQRVRALSDLGLDGLPGSVHYRHHARL